MAKRTTRKATPIPSRQPRTRTPGSSSAGRNEPPGADERAGAEGRAMIDPESQPKPHQLTGAGPGRAVQQPLATPMPSSSRGSAGHQGDPGNLPSSPPPVDMNSLAFHNIGISGLTRFGVVSRVYEEFLRELQGPQGMKSYREMADNCPITGAILFAANQLGRKVTFKVRPANGTNEARYIADKIGSMVFDDMESTWPDTVSEILTMLPFGWSAMEYRMKRRLGTSEPQRVAPPPQYGSVNQTAAGYPTPTFAPSRFDDGLIGFRSWSLRSQETLFMWEFDEDSKAVVMQQMAPPDYHIRRIPLSKMLLFRTQVAKNNPEGRSILRNAWTSYYFKKNLQVFEGIGIERDLAGYPVIQMAPPDLQKGQAPPNIWNDKDPAAVSLLAAMQKLVRSVRRDEQEGMVLPWWAEFKLLSTGSRRRVETNEIIGRYDQRIAMSVMADFIMLGHEAVGSKALASTKISLFTSALSAFLDNACSVINRHAFPLLMAFNGWPQELTPSLFHGDVESINLQELGTFIKDIAQTGFNPLAHPDAQIAVMETANLPTTGIEGSEGVSGVGDAEAGEGGTMDAGGNAPVAPSTSPLGAQPRLETT